MSLRVTRTDKLCSVADSNGVKPQTNDPSFASLHGELVWRGLIHVSTDESALREALDGDALAFY